LGWTGPFTIKVKSGQIVLIAVGLNPSDFADQFLLKVNYSPEPIAPNDLFDQRLMVDGFGYTNQSIIVNSTAEEGEPAHGAAGTSSLWWQYTAPTNGTVFVECDTGSVFDPLLILYRGDQLTNLQPVMAVTNAVLAFAVHTGELYQVCLASLDGRAGPFELGIHLQEHPANDDIAQAIPLSGTLLTIHGNNFNATQEVSEPRLFDDADGHTVWWSWIAPTSGVMRITNKSALSSIVSVLRGNDLAMVTSAHPPYRSLAFNVTKDEMYYFVVDGNAGETGFLEFELAFVQVMIGAVNDDFYEPGSLYGNQAGASWFNLGATRQVNEPVLRPGNGNRSIWWRWRATFTGLATFGLDPEQSTVKDVTLAAYQGNHLDTLYLVTRTNAQLMQFPVEVGRFYDLVAETSPDDIGILHAVLNYSGYHRVEGAVPGNLVHDPDFSGSIRDFWQLTGNIQTITNENGVWVTLGYHGELRQEISTVAGEHYRIHVGWDPCGFGQGAVSFGGINIGIMNYYWSEPAPFAWTWSVFEDTASTNITTLRILNTGNSFRIKCIYLEWIHDPPKILAPPHDTQGALGSTVSLNVNARGVEPLSYQWLFNGLPLTGPGSDILNPDQVKAEQAGQYSVIISNAFGCVTSSPALLTLFMPSAPKIVIQSASLTAHPGQCLVLSANAEAEEPINYQWYFNGQPIKHQTNRFYILPYALSTDAGEYVVKVSHYAATTASLPIIVTMDDSHVGGARVMLANKNQNSHPPLDAPIFDVDQQTRLSGGDYLVQLYAGRNADDLQPVGDPLSISGGIINEDSVMLAETSFGEIAWIQLRVWRRSQGVSYEEARALGGVFGRSDLLEIHTDPSPWNTTLLTGLKSFSLSPGITNFTPGNLSVSFSPAAGQPEWKLQAPAGFRYLVERADPSLNWQPWIVLTNINGVVTFTDTVRTAPGTGLYRTRIVD
jgi:hypothetical protein